MKFSFKQVCLFLLAISSSCTLPERNQPPETCCPEGPPFSPICSEGYYYFFSENQLTTVPSIQEMISTPPFSQTGAIIGAANSETIPAKIGSGFLINDRFVLTAAHVIRPDGNLKVTLSFALCQFGVDCRPYGVIPVRKIWIPQEYVQSNNIERRAYDFALLELTHSPTNPFGPNSTPIITNVVNHNIAYDEMENLTPFGTGYGCNDECNSIGGIDVGTMGIVSSQLGMPFTTGGEAQFKGYNYYEEHDNNGGIFIHDVEATGGMSGGPLWIRQNNQARIIGVMVGSPQSVCEQRENWSSALTDGTNLRLIGAMNDPAIDFIESFESTQMATRLFFSEEPSCNELN